MTRRTKLVAVYSGLIALQLGLATHLLSPLWRTLLDSLWIRAELGGQGWLSQTFWWTLAEGARGFTEVLGLVVALAAAAAVGALGARMVGWRAVRAGRRDPIQALRQRPWAVRLVAFAPAIAYLASQAGMIHDFFHGLAPHQEAAWLATAILRLVLPQLAVTLGLGKLGSMVMQELTEPLAEQSAAAPRGNGNIVFSAVAVTQRTRAAVGGLALVGTATALWVAAAPLATLQKSPAFMGLIVAYVAAAAGAAWAFRRVSRVAVGIDGVYVGEAASTRFFAYREMVLARISGAIARARSGETRGAEALVQTMAARRRVAAAAIEAPGYREASLTRDHLWELVEGAATDAPTRTAAAEALAVTLPLDEDERSRLRVAASRVADPRVRVAIGSLARDEEEEGEGDGHADRALSG